MEFNTATIRSDPDASVEPRPRFMREIGIRTGLLRSIVLPIGDVFWGQQMTSRLKFLEEAQWWPVEKIQDRQREDLTRLIFTSYNEVPF